MDTMQAVPESNQDPLSGISRRRCRRMKKMI